MMKTDIHDRQFRPVAAWAAIAVCLASLSAAAQDMSPPMPGEHGPGPMARGMPGPHERNGPGGGPGDAGPLKGLARAEADQIAAQTIADLAHAPLGEVQRIVRTWDVPTALRYFDVAPKAFHDAATPRLVALVRAEAGAQHVSAAESERIVDQLQADHRPPPPP